MHFFFFFYPQCLLLFQFNSLFFWLAWVCDECTWHIPCTITLTLGDTIVFQSLLQTVSARAITLTLGNKLYFSLCYRRFLHIVPALKIDAICSTVGKPTEVCPANALCSTKSSGSSGTCSCKENYAPTTDKSECSESHPAPIHTQKKCLAALGLKPAPVLRLAFESDPVPDMCDQSYFM